MSKKWVVVCHVNWEYRDEPIVEGLFDTEEDARSYITAGLHFDQLVDEGIYSADDIHPELDHSVVPLSIAPESGYIG